MLYESTTRLALVVSALVVSGYSLGGARDVQADLIKAIEQRDLAATRAALDKGASATTPGGFNRTPLHTAAKESTAEIVELLLQRGANPNARDNDGRTPLHLAHSLAAPILLRFKADVHALDKLGNSPLHMAAEEGGPSTCQLFVEAGVPVNIRNAAGLTPLHFAALQGKQRNAEYLLGKGADINARTTAAYSYKWSYVGWDVQGMEEPVKAGETAVSIARAKHKKNKWVSGNYQAFADYLVSKGAVEKKGWWPFQ